MKGGQLKLGIKFGRKQKIALCAVLCIIGAWVGYIVVTAFLPSDDIYELRYADDDVKTLFMAIRVTQPETKTAVEEYMDQLGYWTTSLGNEKYNLNIEGEENDWTVVEEPKVQWEYVQPILKRFLFLDFSKMKDHRFSISRGDWRTIVLQ